MAGDTSIRSLFLDIGGVLLTNGWDRHARKRAVDQFGLDEGELNERHHLTFDTYEEGKLSLDQYLDRVVFHTQRAFPREDFKAFMFAQTQPVTEMMELIRRLKAQYGLKTVAVSNEGRELTNYRIRTYKLDEFVDSFVSSCFVHYRKPDHDIFRIALDVSHSKPEETMYVDDRVMFVEVARTLGILGLHHEDYRSTRAELARRGLAVPDE
jgi:putative hydrolase of the HAD superfamily